MAMKVPQYRSTVALRPEKQQNKAVRTSPDAFGASVGRGLQEVAAGGMNVAAALQYRDRLKAEADARLATDALRDTARTEMYDPENGYMFATGANAVNGQREAMLEQLNRERERIAETLTPEARKIFEQQAMDLDNRIQDTAITHEGTELRDYTLGAFMAAAEGNLEEAIRNADNDEKFTSGLNTALEEVNAASALAGKSPAETAKAQAQITSSAYSGRVLAFAREDPSLAFEYLQAHKGDIDVDTYNKLHAGLEGAYYADQARGWVSENTVGAAYGGTGGGYGLPIYGFDVEVKMIGDAAANPPQAQTVGVVGRAVQSVLGPGAQVEISSGTRAGDHGSQHADGGAADVTFYREDGTVIFWNDPEAKQIALAAAAMGAKGFGAGPNYMGGTRLHIDLGDGAVGADGRMVSPVRGGIQVWSDDGPGGSSGGPGAAEWQAELQRAYEEGPAYFQGMPQGAAGALEGLGIPAFIVGPESTGDVNAVNPLSGAAGPVQFTADTYLGLVRELQPQWAAGMSDEDVLKTRSDIEKMAPIYREFRARNAHALRTAGYPVTPRNEYIAHHFGAKGAKTLLDIAAGGGGNQSLVEALNARGINGKQWAAQNPWMTGQTVNGALQWFDNKVAAYGGGGGGSINPALAMERALEIEDPKLRAAVMSELQLRQSVAENARAERARVTNQRAWDIIDAGGTPDDIPPSLQVEVGARTMNTIFDTYERNLTGVDNTDETRYLELFDMAMGGSREEQEAFVGLDLNEDRPNLSRGDLRQLKVLQAEMRADMEAAKAEGPPEVTLYSDADFRSANSDAEAQFAAVMGHDKPSDMANADRRRLAELQSIMRARMRDFANREQRPMTFDERQKMVAQLLAPVIIEGVDRSWKPFNVGDTRLFEAANLARSGQAVELQYERADVPPELEREIAEQFKAAYGRLPTADEIVEQYENEVLLDLRLDRAIEYKDIPKETRKSLEELYPDAGPAELPELYLELMLEVAKREVVQ
jgi:hypothetical protein